MILAPKNTPGINILRGMGVFGHIGDHAEIIFENVRVPTSNIVLGEGRGFEIAQGRLGPGRIHHAKRTIGQAEQALEAIIYRVQNREAFGGELSKKATIRQTIAESCIDIEMTRQLCYLAAVMADEHGFKEARKYIAMIKVAAPRAVLKIVDEAIQIHGAHNVSQDSNLAGMSTGLRTIRVADGPDIVHMNTIAKMELARPPTVMGEKTSGINQSWGRA